MKPEQINIAIAEHLEEEIPAWCCVMHGAVPTDRVVNNSCPWCYCPVEWDGKDYAGDLNAMHEVEKTLTSQQAMRFSRVLQRICIAMPVDGLPAVEYGWHASAIQRAEAFLRTLGLYKE